MEGEVIISIQIQKVKMRTACLTNPLLLLPGEFKKKKKKKKDVTWDDHQTMWSSFSSRKLLIEGTVQGKLPRFHIVVLVPCEMPA